MASNPVAEKPQADQKNKEDAEPQVPLGPLARFWNFIRPILILVAVLFAVRSSLADWNDVPTGSMMPTIMEGDRIFVNKLAYDLKVPFTTIHLAEWANPQRGDIVVFFSPEPQGTRLVKRCVGLPGDKIEVRMNQIILNDVPLSYAPFDPNKIKYLSNADKTQMQYLTETIGAHVHPIREGDGLHPLPRSWEYHNRNANYGPVIIPPGKYFMMGDNRDNSADSRFFTALGGERGEHVFVDRSQIVGKATAVAISLDLNNYWIPRWSRFFSSLP